jgi:hypothetical protein
MRWTHLTARTVSPVVVAALGLALFGLRAAPGRAQEAEARSDQEKQQEALKSQPRKITPEERKRIRDAMLPGEAKDPRTKTSSSRRRTSRAASRPPTAEEIQRVLDWAVKLEKSRDLLAAAGARDDSLSYTVNYGPRVSSAFSLKYGAPDLARVIEGLRKVESEVPEVRFTRLTLLVVKRRDGVTWLACSLEGGFFRARRQQNLVLPAVDSVREVAEATGLEMVSLKISQESSRARIDLDGSVGDRDQVTKSWRALLESLRSTAPSAHLKKLSIRQEGRTKEKESQRWRLSLGLGA